MPKAGLSWIVRVKRHYVFCLNAFSIQQNNSSLCSQSAEPAIMLRIRLLVLLLYQIKRHLTGVFLFAEGHSAETELTKCQFC